MACCLEPAKIEEKIKNNTQSKVKILPEPVSVIKHPLQYSWSLWIYVNDKSKTWEENLIELTTFDTVEDFWCLYHHIKLPTELRQGNDYAVFKKGVRPMWEDDANKMGGRWLINIDRKQRSANLNKYWLDIILLMIGENFENSEAICGAVVNIRGKFDKIGVWTGHTYTKPVVEIGKTLKEVLGIQTKFGFEVHRDTMSKQGSTSKFLYIV
ncbi:eukaryotic translation initiation factor 4E-1A-like [Leptidea sinapis]|uniref:eIF-4F 25 kDa subunit n=1 Tax=Leptidea sinapis TaxID=189913 RepID=A0A5E4PUE0_9NEOP|nr:eukaryotic translation initiation factor 4E-1A-like [Leptidea sinapis]XP_050676106.1 eukaryotic translation initiation factor 4E-1A-like [Leptidea sinapis]VVC88521.1 unnamed protein product [Leptidea sinapis]